MARVIDDRFELLGRLGGGGMGLVWRARDLALHREVALKEVRPPDPGLAEYDPEAARALRARVLREARALARIVHPNVVTIHHIVDGGEHTYPWLVMELVTGGSLQDRLDRGPLAPVEAAGLGRGILAGLRAAHAADIQHRDIKPPNVLLWPDGRPVLTDFGIAAVQGATVLTAAGSVIGTPDYMAPERVAGQDGGPAADLWSLAMTLYVAVEGHNPLRRANTLATLAAVLSEDVPPPRNAGPLTAALTSVLVRNPDARPDAETLDRLLAGAEAVTAPAATDAFAGGPSSYPLAPPQPTGRQPLQSSAQPVDTPSHAGVHPPMPPGQPAQLPAPRRRQGWMYAAGLGAVALAGLLVWTLLPTGNGSDGDKPEGSGRDSAKPSTSGTPDGGSGSSSGSGADDGSGGGEKITIGVKSDQPGLGFKTPDGHHTGFDVDVATYLAKELGHDAADIEWKEVSSSERESLLQRGEVDLVVATYGITDQRATKVDFAGPYLVAHQDVLMNANEVSIGTAADLNGKKVCAAAGSSAAIRLKTQFAPTADVQERDTYSRCLTDLKAGAVDAVTTDDAILAGYAAKEPGKFKLGGFALTEERYGIGVPKGSALAEPIQAALDKMASDGSWNKALRKNLPLMPTDTSMS